MTFEEVSPHLNKISRLRLKNNKRKVGWLYYDSYHQLGEEPMREVHCVNVHYGRRLVQPGNIDPVRLRPYAARILMEDIVDIRSCG